MNDIVKKDSLKKRYFFKLFTNIIGIPISIVTQSIIPRGLGPIQYGNFSFLSNFFLEVVGFLDNGTSFAFYTKLSQRPEEMGLLRFYWKFVKIVILFFLVTVFCLIQTQQCNLIWPKQKTLFIWMGVFYSILLWLTQIMTKIIDAYGQTRQGEMARLVQKIVSLLFILLMFWANKFDLASFFIYQYVILILLIFMWWNILRSHKIIVHPKYKLSHQQLKKYFQEFYRYSMPLITYTVLGLMVGIGDKWLLQKFGGAVEQGFYGLSYQIGYICFLFTSAMTPLILREFSIVFHENNLIKMKEIFLRYIPMLYAVTVFFSVFIFLQGKNVALIMGGEKYIKAAFTISIMALYPIHQTYGQLSSSVFLACGQTKLYRNIGSFTILGLFLTYILVAPKTMFGFSLGSIGLALKMVIIQFIIVNIQLWFNCKYLKMSFIRLFAHQLYTILIFAFGGIVSVFIVNLFFIGAIVNFLLSGVLYSLFAFAVLHLFPSIFSTNRNELLKYKGELQNFILKRIEH